MEAHSPDELALLLAQQFLSDRGFNTALRETEKAHGLKYVDSKLPRGSMLLQMVYDLMEKEAASTVDSDEAALQEEEELLMQLMPEFPASSARLILIGKRLTFAQGGASDFPCHEAACISGKHSTNITSVCHDPDADTIFTGAGDGTVQAFSSAGEQKWQTRRTGGGAAISLALNQRVGQPRLLSGFMDGTLTVLDTEGGKQLAEMKVHTKYVVRALWAPSGALIVSVSWDGSVSVTEFAETGLDAASLKVIKTLPFPTAIQDVIFLPGGGKIMLALRDTNSLRIRNFPGIETGDEKVNLNALGDSHVSFSARQLAVSPNSNYLLVSTDTSRIAILRIQGWRHLTGQIVGLPLDTFHNSVAQWHCSGFYIMAAAAAGQIFVFHVGTGKVVAKFKAHQQNVRWLDYDASKNLLYSCSFDRTVKIWSKPD